MPTSADYREMADRSAQLAIASSCDSVAEALLALALNYIKLSARGGNIGSQQLQDSSKFRMRASGTRQEKSVAYFAYFRHVLEDRSDATTAGISGEMIRDMMVQCVERRFGSIRASHRVQWLTGQGIDLCSSQDDRDRFGAQSRVLLHACRESGEQRDGRGLRENLRARLCPCRHRARLDRKLDGRLQHRSPALAIGLPFTPRVHRYTIAIRCVSGLIESNPRSFYSSTWSAVASSADGTVRRAPLLS